ncbi:Uncharacterised protein [Acinetobacter baumannii]|nr:Uncharacterised protein [Acinetobacter baumannii]
MRYLDLPQYTLNTRHNGHLFVQAGLKLSSQDVHLMHQVDDLKQWHHRLGLPCQSCLVSLNHGSLLKPVQQRLHSVQLHPSALKSGWLV